MDKLVILEKAHDRAGFDCGVEELNQFLRKTARQHIEKGLSTTRVLLAEDGKTIKGYYSLTLCEIWAGSLPLELAKRFPSVPLPAILLGRLAVASSYHNQGVGSALLLEAIRDSVAVMEKASGIGMVVDAKNERAGIFYRNFGFEELSTESDRLFMPIQKLRKSVDVMTVE